MADSRKRFSENTAGDFFVDATCIDCDTCRQVAPEVFIEGDGHSFVHHQPETAESRRHALQALVCCPTGSIGSLGDDAPASVMDDFPLPIDGPVSYCGFTSPKSYGGSSYFVRDAGGNWLIDAPKFLPRLVKRFEELDGIDHIFLTHRDDVADADRYAKHFGARRYIHRTELHAQPEAEVVLEGFEDRELAPGFLAVPTPGHTEGHCVLLVGGRYLFTGDHLEFNRRLRWLAASREHCWFSWQQQTESVRRLLDLRFEWVLPGHGQRVHLPERDMKRQLHELVERMRTE